MSSEGASGSSPTSRARAGTPSPGSDDRGATRAAEPLGDPPVAARVLSSFRGRIGRLLLSYPTDRAYDYVPLVETHAGILAGLGPGVDVLALAPRRMHDALRRMAARVGASGLTLVAVDDRPSPSIWSRDIALALRTPGGRITLLRPCRLDRAGDERLAELAAAAAGLTCRTSRFAVQGGNLLVGDDYALIGLDEPSGGSSSEDLSAELGVSTLVPAGPRMAPAFAFAAFQGRWQPLFHLDLYVTLMGPQPDGRDLVFVGDPRLASTILGREAPPSSVVAAFDGVAEHLAAWRGPGPRFEVRRLPLHLSPEAERPAHAHFLSYNNCLVERVGDVRRVCMPTYAADGGSRASLAELDAAAAESFATAGFEVRMIPGHFAALARRGGSLRCVTNVLDRSPEPEPSAEGSGDGASGQP